MLGISIDQNMIPNGLNTIANTLAPSIAPRSNFEDDDDETWEQTNKRVIGDKQRLRHELRRGGTRGVSVVGPSRKVVVQQVSLESRWSVLGTVNVVVDNTLSAVLQEAGKRGMEVLELFQPPEALYSGFGKTHTQLQIFMAKAEYRGPTQFCVKNVEVVWGEGKWLEDEPPVLAMPAVDKALAQFGAKNYMLAAVYDPPSTTPSWDRTSHSNTIQLVFQRPYLCPSPHPPTFTFLTVPLTCVVRDGTTEILELSPTIHDLAAQGYRLCGAYNPPISRLRQSKGLASTIFFYFECAVHHPPTATTKYVAAVLKGQITVTNVSFGIKVRGQYVNNIREYSRAGWSLVTVIDVPDSITSSLTTIYLVFSAVLSHHKHIHAPNTNNNNNDNDNADPNATTLEHSSSPQNNNNNNNRNNNKNNSNNNMYMYSDYSQIASSNGSSNKIDRLEGGYQSDQEKDNFVSDGSHIDISGMHSNHPETDKAGAFAMDSTAVISPEMGKTEDSTTNVIRNHRMSSQQQNSKTPSVYTVKEYSMSRLFREEGVAPQPMFVYAHNLPVFDEEANQNDSNHECQCCVIL